MSKEAVRLFLEEIEQDEELQKIVLTAFKAKDNSIDLIALGRDHGFQFTEAEGLEVWDELQNEEELSDFALELISGGHANSDGT